MSTINFDSQGREIVEPPQTEGAKKFVCRVCGRDAQRVSGGWSCNHGEQPACKCVEQGYPEQDCKWHGEAATHSEQKEWAKAYGPNDDCLQIEGMAFQVNTSAKAVAAKINTALAAERDWSTALYRNLNDEKKAHRHTLAALAAERQLREQAEKERNKWRKDFANIVEDRRQIRQQLLSAQVAIERAIIHDRPPTLCQEKLDLSALREHDAEVATDAVNNFTTHTHNPIVAQLNKQIAEVRKPLVEALADCESALAAFLPQHPAGPKARAMLSKLEEAT